MKSDSFVSVVLVHDQPLALLEEPLARIQRELDSRYTDYEIVVVGQGTVVSFSQRDQGVLQRVPSLRYIQLSSSLRADVAWGAALENAIGDFVVTFNPALDPVEAISDSVALCKSGYDVVVGVAAQPSTLAYRTFRSLARSALTLVDYALPRDATGLRCLSRRAVNAVTTTGRYHHQLAMRIQKTGYPQTAYRYTLHCGRHKMTPRSLLAGVRDLLSLMVFNSSRPLRWMSALGLFGSSAAFMFAVYSLVVHLVKRHVVEGWTTTILFMSALFMLQFIMMAFFGEYLGRLLDERSEQAGYSVVFEKNSAVMVNQDRVNVFSEASTGDLNRVQTGRNR